MEPEFEILCLGSVFEPEKTSILQKLLFLGITEYRLICVPDDSRSFHQALKKASPHVLCIGVSEPLKQLALEFSEKKVLWLPDDFSQLEEALCSQVLYFSLDAKPLIENWLSFFPSVKIRLYTTLSHLSLVFSSSSREALFEATLKVRDSLAKFEVVGGLLELSQEIQNKMIARSSTLVCAESCTGGFLAHAITKHPGSSAYFLGSMVCYCNELKQKVLGVSPSTLQTYGAVSSETVYEMARGALDLSGADYALATSGVAGPGGGTPQSPIGTVWFAIGSKLEGIETRRLEIHDSRQNVIHLSVYFTLFRLFNLINN